MDKNPKHAVSVLLLIAVPILGISILVGLMVFCPPEEWVAIIRNHFASTVGLSLAALAAAFIVIGLRQSSGPIKFEGFGVKFEGSSGEVILWIICFLSIVGSIRLLWNIG